MIGKVMLAAGVLIAHTELAHEKVVDLEVIKSFRVERILTLTGLLLIVGGYFMEVYFYGFTTSLLTCFGPSCVNAAATAVAQ